MAKNMRLCCTGILHIKANNLVHTLWRA